MKVLSKIKSYFSKKESQPMVDKKTSSTPEEITCYDTNLVILPKYSELPEELKVKVNEFFEEINPDSYETLIHYGKTLQKRADDFTSVLMQVLKSIAEKDISITFNNSKSSAEIFQELTTSLINKEKLSFCFKEIKALYDDARLRAIAIERYAKKESLRKFDLFGIFGRAERLMYIKHKETLRTVVEISLITVKILEEKLRCVIIALNEENNYNQAVEIYSKLCSDIIGKDFRNLSCVKYLRSIRDEVLFNYNLCLDSSNHLHSIKNRLNTIVDNEYAHIANRFRLSDEEKKLLVTYEHAFAEIIAGIEVFIQIYSVENETEYKTFIEEITEDIDYFKNVMTHDAINNESKELIDQLKGRTLYYHRFLTRIYKISGKTLDDDDKELFIMKHFCNLIYFLIETGNYDFVVKKIQDGEFGGNYGIKVSEERIEKMLEEYLKGSIENIDKFYGYYIYGENVKVLSELFNFNRELFNEVVNGNILDIGIAKTTYFQDSSGICVVDRNMKKIELQKIDGTELDTVYLSKHLISFAELFEYFEFAESSIHRYNVVDDGMINLIIKTALASGGFRVYANPHVFELMTAIIQRGVYKKFGFNIDAARPFDKVPKKNIAFIPRLVKSISCSGNKPIFLPVRYFNKNTKYLYIHDAFDFENSNLRPVFDKLKNLEVILISRKKYDEIFEFINFPGGQFGDYKFEFVDNPPHYEHIQKNTSAGKAV